MGPREVLLHLGERALYGFAIAILGTSLGLAVAPRSSTTYHYLMVTFVFQALVLAFIQGYNFYKKLE